MPLFLGGTGFGLDMLVQTETEKIKLTIKTLAEAVEQENPEAIERVIAENYRDSYHKTKKRLMTYCRGRLSRPLVEEHITRIREIEISSPKATTILTSRVIFDERSYIYQAYKREIFIKAQLELQKQADDTWLIERIEILEVDRLPAKWKSLYR